MKKQPYRWIFPFHAPYINTALIYSTVSFIARLLVCVYGECVCIQVNHCVPFHSEHLPLFSALIGWLSCFVFCPFSLLSSFVLHSLFMHVHRKHGIHALDKHSACIIMCFFSFFYTFMRKCVQIHMCWCILHCCFDVIFTLGRVYKGRQVLRRSILELAFEQQTALKFYFKHKN